MPPLIGAAIVAVIGETAAATIGATAISAIAYGITTIATIGAQFALSRLTAKKQKGDPQITAFTIRQPIPTRVRCYGTVKIAGALFYEDALPVVYQPLVLGVVFCEGPVSNVRTYYLNDAATAITGPTGINLALPWATNIAIEGRVGTDSQTANGQLSTLRGMTVNLNGLCYATMVCAQPIRPDKYFQYYFPNGIPNLRIHADTSPVYDPRDGTQVWATKSTWKYSSNSALVVLDYLTITRNDSTGKPIPRGMGLSKTRINLASFSAFANVCDDVMNSAFTVNPVDGSVSTTPSTERRYSCHGTYNLDEAPTDVLSRLLATCDGTLYTDENGLVCIRGGKWDTPTVNITDDMILSCGELVQGNGKFEKFNQLKISYTAWQLDYQITEGSPWEDLDDQDANGVLSQSLSLPYVTSYSQARRLAKIDMAKGNPQWRYNSLICTFAALNALNEQFIHVQHTMPGIDNDFMVTGFKIHVENKTVELQLVSIDSSAYSWDAATEDEAPPSSSGIVSSVGSSVAGGSGSSGGAPGNG